MIKELKEESVYKDREERVGFKFFSAKPKSVEYGGWILIFCNCLAK